MSHTFSSVRLLSRLREMTNDPDVDVHAVTCMANRNVMCLRLRTGMNGSIVSLRNAVQSAAPLSDVSIAESKVDGRQEVIAIIPLGSETRIWAWKRVQQMTGSVWMHRASLMFLLFAGTLYALQHVPNEINDRQL